MSTSTAKMPPPLQRLVSAPVAGTGYRYIASGQLRLFQRMLSKNKSCRASRSYSAVGSHADTTIANRVAPAGPLRATRHPIRRYSVSRHLNKGKVDVEALLDLANATWSVSELISSPDDTTLSVDPAQLRHLCRLSALPEPATQEEEDRMLRTLSEQLHFVRAIQRVNTDGVEPLVCIRDETQQGLSEREISVDTPAIAEALRNMTVSGKHKRERRKRDPVAKPDEAGDWDVLGMAERTKSGYFIVDNSKSAT